MIHQTKISSRHFGLMALALLSLSLTACGGGGTTDGLTTSVKDAAPNADLLYGEKRDSLASVKAIYEKNKSPEIAARYGKALRESGDLKGARSVLLPVTGDKNFGTLANTELSAIYLAQGEFPKAESAARKATTQDAANYRAWRNLGNALDAQEKYKEGEAAFRKSLDLWKGKDKVAVINNLALNLAAQGYTDQSLTLLYDAQKMDPKRIEIERNIRIIRTLNEPIEYKGTKKPLPPAKAPE